MADAMAEQTQQVEAVEEDLDARVDALLREMEETTSRVMRRLEEDESRENRPTLEDLAPLHEPPPKPAKGGGRSGGGKTSRTDGAAPTSPASKPAPPPTAKAVMEQAAEDLSAPAAAKPTEETDSVLAAAAADETPPVKLAKPSGPAMSAGAPPATAKADRPPTPPAEADGLRAASTQATAPGDAAAPGDSVDELDQILAAAAADVMAMGEPEEAEDSAPVLDPQVIARDMAAHAERAAQAQTPVAQIQAGSPAARPNQPARPASVKPPVVAVADSDAVAEEDAEAPAPPGPPYAPAAQLAPPAQRPGWKRRAADAIVHTFTGAAAAARPHAIRLAWSIEQFTLRCRRETRATLKFVAVYTMLNAIAVWGFVLMRTPPKPPPVHEETPTVITGAPGTSDAR